MLWCLRRRSFLYRSEVDLEHYPVLIAEDIEPNPTEELNLTGGAPNVKRRQRCSAQAISDRRRCSSRSQSLIKGFASVTTCYTSQHITNIPQHLLSAIMTREVIYSEQFPLKPHNGWWLATPSSDNPQPPPSRFPASCSSPARLRQARSRLPLWVNSSREDSLITYADHGFEQSQGRSRALGL